MTVTAMPLSPDTTRPEPFDPHSAHPSRGCGSELLQMTVRCDGIAGRSELRLQGELDSGNAQRLLDAVAWLRRRGRGLVIVDAGDLSFVDLVGYRTLRAFNLGPVEDGAGEPVTVPGVVLRTGPAVLRLERLLQATT